MKREPVCPRCGSVKKALSSGILRCATCTRTWNRDYYHKSERRRRRQRHWYVERKYGVSIEYLEQLFEKQDRKCAICGRDWMQCPLAKNSRYDMVFLQRLYVDHCHVSGRVRGLLCNNCNLGIGLLDEDLERFDAAKEYLRRHAAGNDAT